MAVITDMDRALWQNWRRERKRQLQRDRRSRRRRIDYHAGPDAAAVLDSLWKPAVGHDFSTIIDNIVMQWLDCHRN